MTDLVRVDARRLRIDYIKPSIVNRGGRPRLEGGGSSNAGSGSNAGIGVSKLHYIELQAIKSFLEVT